MEEHDKKEPSKLEENKAKPSEATVEHENIQQEEQEEERNGIIPEGMDFRKFIGCGG